MKDLGNLTGLVLQDEICEQIVAACAADGGALGLRGDGDLDRDQSGGPLARLVRVRLGVRV